MRPLNLKKIEKVLDKSTNPCYNKYIKRARPSKKGNDTMTTEKTAAQTLGELLGYLLVFFLFPWFVMKGWEAIAWEFNLPQFSYWACFFISHGFRYLTGNLSRS